MPLCILLLWCIVGSDSDWCTGKYLPEENIYLSLADSRHIYE